MAKWWLRIAPVPALLAAGAAGAVRAQAQETATLRGAVVAAESGEPLPYALIRLDPTYDRLFTNERGVFVIPGIAPASYRLFVRQVGYRPFDSTLTVGPHTPPVRIELQRLVVELGGLVVRARERCRRPGPPDSAARAELVTVFEQLTLNAQRHSVLLDRYPFRQQLERERASRRRNGRTFRDVDTLVYRSDHRWRYTPGRVIDVNPSSAIPGSYIVHFPTLSDLADSLFQATHCFILAGLDTLAGGPWIRLDFKVSEAVRDPDVDGSVYLDPATYQVRRTRIVVTHVGRVVRGVRSFTALALYRELLPNLIVVDQASANSLLVAGMEHAAVTNRIERKRLLQVSFVRTPGRDTVP